ncbi:MAG: hypothetical protein M3Y27_08765 [Acidobacteriota bacterium]|nr:hypothetical protein [Acidobacteriota bacterium]
MICPLIESLGFEVETGRELAGQKLDEGVKRKIEGCDGLVAFLSCVTPIAGSDLFKASDWVVQEYTHADTLGKLVVAVRETNVDFQGLLAGNRQWIALDPDNRLAATVELCRALRKWHSGIDIELKLNTQSFVDAILGRVMDRKYRSLYVLRHREGREMARIENAAILPRTGGLFVYAKNVPKDAFIEFTVEFDGETWTSLGREVQTIEIELKKEGEA